MGLIDLWSRLLEGYAVPRGHLECVRRLGLGYGYPPCCVEAFVRDMRWGRHAAHQRGTVHPNRTKRGKPSSAGSYVPCRACIPKAHRAGTWQPPQPVSGPACRQCRVARVA